MCVVAARVLFDDALTCAVPPLALGGGVIGGSGDAKASVVVSVSLNGGADWTAARHSACSRLRSASLAVRRCEDRHGRRLRLERERNGAAA